MVRDDLAGQLTTGKLVGDPSRTKQGTVTTCIYTISGGGTMRLVVDEPGGNSVAKQVFDAKRTAATSPETVPNLGTEAFTDADGTTFTVRTTRSDRRPHRPARGQRPDPDRGVVVVRGALLLGGLRPDSSQPSYPGDRCVDRSDRRPRDPRSLGVDSSTQSCTVEVRDLDSGRASPAGASPAPATTPPRSEQTRPLVGGPRTAAREHAGEVAALSVAAQQHGMVALDADRDARAPREALERHRVGPRPPRSSQMLGAEAWVERCRQRARGRLHRHQAGLAADHEPDVARRRSGGAAAARLADAAPHRRAGHRPGRRLRHRLLSPAGAPGARTCWTLVGHGVEVCPEVLGADATRRAAGVERRGGPAPATTWPPRSAWGCAG